MQSQLHIPRGIRFQCTACGHCCHEYPVPLTDDDVRRLEEADGEACRTSVSALTASERAQSGLAAFTHSLDKHQSGNCSFLTEDKKCRVHDTAKPSMCRLFPYTFLHCPDGLKVGLSFASTGVLFNSGERLSEQHPQLIEMRDVFNAMYPNLARTNLERWGESEFVGGSALDYEDFSKFCRPYLTRLEALIESYAASGKQSPPRDNAQVILSEMADVLCDSLPPSMLNPMVKLFGKLNPVKLDQYILMPLYRAYFASPPPVDEEQIGIAVQTYLQNEDRDLYFIVADRKISFADLAATVIESLTAQEQDLINRFVYMRLFTRLFFGPGFSMMPLLSGLFHLSVLVMLLHLDLKIDAIRQSAAGESDALSQTRFDKLVARVRDIDRRLTAVVYSRDAGSMFELFALDPLRLRRFLLMTN
ncbi:MAG: YkgJ family cysteine cluster protein [Cyanobacteria bacterium SZAS TMP-1]|nr:YkgJ family cysteine cluster protein [Cyanobacteria bacterium SZAS TMP-1]